MATLTFNSKFLHKLLMDIRHWMIPTFDTIVLGHSECTPRIGCLLRISYTFLSVVATDSVGALKHHFIGLSAWLFVGEVHAYIVESVCDVFHLTIPMVWREFVRLPCKPKIKL